MSFILDALKKSENERQLNTPPEFATVPADPDSPRAPRWLWVLAGLLLVNLLVVAALLTRDTAPASATPAGTPAAAAASPASPTPAARPADAFAERLEEARRSLPVRAPVPSAAAADSPATGPDASGAQSAATDAGNVLLLPSLDELRLNGELDLPDLHVDIHVWSEDPDERFVFINMDKYRERDTMSAGPVVHEITRDGVVLGYRGRRFVLSRD